MLLSHVVSWVQVFWHQNRSNILQLINLCTRDINNPHCRSVLVARHCSCCSCNCSHEPNMAMLQRSQLLRSCNCNVQSSTRDVVRVGSMPQLRRLSVPSALITSTNKLSTKNPRPLGYGEHDRICCSTHAESPVVKSQLLLHRLCRPNPVQHSSSGPAAEGNYYRAAVALNSVVAMRHHYA